MKCQPMCDAERDWIESARLSHCSKNGGKNSMRSDAKKRLLRENINIYQPTFNVQNLAISF